MEPLATMDAGIAPITPLDRALIDGWQRGFPLVPRPYRVLAGALGVSEADVLTRLAHLSRLGVLSRIGAVLRPNTAGASTLAAMRVPEARLMEVAEIVNGEPGVNHNYEREHAFNLWFVVTGRDRAAVDRTLARIEARTGLALMDLPMERAYFLDLGFPLTGERTPAPQAPPGERADQATLRITAKERALLEALEPGLALTGRPYEALAHAIGWTEAGVLRGIGALIGRGLISRFGLVVRHRELGYRANAMVVWDVPDEAVDRVGRLFAAEPLVRLCYRRPRRLPGWPYNLFCMIHGRARAPVEAEARRLARLAGLEARPHALLFSRRRFKQCGARLSAA